MQVKYIVSGLLPSREPKIYYAGPDIPTLGVARHESAINGDSYLVMDPSEELCVREVPQQKGGASIRIPGNSRMNPPFTFQPSASLRADCNANNTSVTVQFVS